MLYKATQIPGKKVADLLRILFKTKKSQIKVCFPKHSRNSISDYTWHNGFQKKNHNEAIRNASKNDTSSSRCLNIEYLYTVTHNKSG